MRSRGLLILFVLVAGCGSRSALLGDDLDARRDGPNSSDAAPADYRPAGDRPDAGPGLRERVIRGCVIGSACAEKTGLGWGALSPSACLDLYSRLHWVGAGLGNYMADPLLVRRMVDCATTHGASCAGFRSCFGGSWFDLRRCREGGQCMANLLGTPQNNALYYDCSSIGSTCVNLASGAQRACCNEQVCASSSTVTCAGSKGTYCHPWGYYHAFDCGPTGRVCAPSPSVLCAGTGSACSDTQPPTCSGSKAAYCSGGKLASLDCSQNLFRSACTTSLGNPCDAQGKQCTPQSFVGRCSGTRLVLCADGYEQEVDCVALGFKGCDLPAQGFAGCTAK